MRKIQEVLRLAALGHSRRAIGRSVGIIHGTVGLYLQAAEAAGLLGQAAEQLSETELEPGCSRLRMPRRRGRFRPGRRLSVSCGGRA